MISFWFEFVGGVQAVYFGSDVENPGLLKWRAPKKLYLFSEGQC